MIEKKDYAAVQRRLQEHLRRRFEDAVVQIGDDIHYKGTNVVVTSRAFEGLLPEQRFHHVVRAIPRDLYQTHLRTGVVWFELVPGQSSIDLMKMPRAEDVACKESDIRRRLEEADFASRFRALFDADPQRASITHFDATRRILAEAGWPDVEINRACLFMILQGAYCDAHVLNDVLPKLTSEHAA